MKKYMYHLIFAFLLVASFTYTPAFAASNNTQVNNVKEGIEVKEENGWNITIVTKEATLKEFIDSQNQKQLQVHNTTGLLNSTIITPSSYLQEDHLYGSGSKTFSGLTGVCWTNDLLIGLNAVGGIISGTVYAYSGNSGVTSKPRVELTTWGLVGGSFGVIRDYTFTSSSYSSGTVAKFISQNLTGAIAYYSVSLYGDHVKSSIEFTSNATLYLQ